MTFRMECPGELISKMANAFSALLQGKKKAKRQNAILFFLTTGNTLTPCPSTFTHLVGLTISQA